jgi:large subunit ribosomal protein L10
MPSIKNIEIVKDLQAKIRKAKSIVLADYRGLKAEDINNLRAQIKEKGGETIVAKNTLFKAALMEEKVNIAGMEKDLKGPTTAILSYNDAISPIKALVEFSKKLELPKIKSAIVEGVYANASKVDEISNIPTKEVLIARMLGSLKAPLSGLTNTLSGVQRKFVYALNAIKETKEGGVQK